MGNAERQRRHRERMKEQGLVHIQGWVDQEQASAIRAIMAGESVTYNAGQIERVSEPLPVPEPPAPEKPATKRSGRVTSRPGQQAHEVEVWRGENIMPA